MATRAFRTEESISAERSTRSRVEGLLERHGLTVTDRTWIERGIAITQVIEASLGNRPPMRMHVRLCWRRDGRNSREDLYSAAQLRARLDDGDWDRTLANIEARHARDGYTHLLLVQDSAVGFVFAVLIPSDQIHAIWSRQREVSNDVIGRGLAGSLNKNHAANGSSPTLWLQDDRFQGTPEVGRVIWEWPGVINVMALPRQTSREDDNDTWDDLPGIDEGVGRDLTARVQHTRSGYPRDPKVRAAVRDRANGHCERAGCAEHRSYPGFLDVHHILGIGVSDRVWTCVALCPNCHREAHFGPDSDALNKQLGTFAHHFRIDG